jgi:uncharacterized membrane protein HdeD (DUF308 family)
MTDDLGTDVDAGLRGIWWLPVVRGVLLLIVGFLMLAHPFNTAVALVWVFGIFAVADGILTLVLWFSNRHEEGSVWWAVLGVVSIGFGLVAVVWAPETAKAIFYLIAIWVLVIGILGVIAAATLYRARDIGWFWVLALGLVSFLIGLLMIVNPQETVAVVMVIFGLFAFVAGVLLVVSGFATRAFARAVGRGSATI